MKRLYAWLLALEIDLRLRLRESTHWKGQPGWVVMCEDDESGDWHAMSGGEQFGMNTATGRFPGRQFARNFADFRNRRSQAVPHQCEGRYYVTHQDLLARPLPDRY